jgi:hypothetical protein
VHFWQRLALQWSPHKTFSEFISLSLLLRSRH